MSLQFIVLILSIAILDSVNPSAIIMTFVLLSGAKKPILRSVAYILGILCTYFIFGVALYFSTRYFGSSFKFTFDFSDLINNPPLWSYYAQLILGILIAIYSIFYYKKTNNPSKKTIQSGIDQSILSAYFLGITITGVELSTALPYIGAISSIYLANLGVLTSLIVLFVYCIVFVLPPTLLVVIYVLYKKSFNTITANIQLFLTKYSYLILKYGLLVLGMYFTFDSLIYLTRIF